MTIFRTRQCLVILGMLCVVSWDVPLSAQNGKATVTGVFGELEYHEQSGDVGGLEVFIVKGRSGHFATVQISEGVPDDPVLIPITVEGSVVSFNLKAGSNVLRYRGTVRADGLYGRFDNGAFSDRNDGFFLLGRGRSYWQK